MKSFTFYFDEKLIEAAEEIARAENTTINELINRWLIDYVERSKKMKNYDDTIKKLRDKS